MLSRLGRPLGDPLDQLLHVADVPNDLCLGYPRIGSEHEVRRFAHRHGDYRRRGLYSPDCFRQPGHQKHGNGDDRAAGMLSCRRLLCLLGQALGRRLPLFGHRNWIVVVDSAYPAQSNTGIETIATGTGHIEVLEKTLKAIAECEHIRAKVLIDAELKLLTEEDAPGVTAYRHGLNQLLGDLNPGELDHDQIISKLDESGRSFRILIFKSTLTIPYTSVFLELDCGYWNADAERRLRST